MKNIKYIITVVFILTILISCKKENKNGLAGSLDNNTMMFNGKKLNVYSSGKTSYVSASCSGQGIVGELYVYAGNADKDTVRLTASNLTDYSTKRNPVEWGLSGNTCKVFLLGSFKLAGSTSYTTIKSGYSGTLEFDGNTSLFREETIGTNVPPNVFTAFGAQIAYPCYWKCTF